MPIRQSQPPVIAGPRSRFNAAVLLNEPICREHYLLRLRIAGVFPPTQPGQFIQLGCRPPDAAIDSAELFGQSHQWASGQRPALHQPELCDTLALLRRPFSLAGRGDDKDGAWIEVIHRVVGVGTKWLANRRVGDAVDFIGPLGNWFGIPTNKSFGLLVGGGVGLPPMFYLAQALRAAHWSGVGFVGAMTDDLLAVHFDQSIHPDAKGRANRSVIEFARHDFDSVVTTDDGSAGLPGRITAGLTKQLQEMDDDQRQQALIYTCGPEPMMHAVAELAREHDVACQVCLEQAMACGMGTCQSCVVKIKHEQHQPPAHGQTADGRAWRYRLACTDGPVFNAHEVIW